MSNRNFDIHEAARGRWRSILTALGVSEHLLDTRKNQPCPFCPGGGGKDRYRFTDYQGGGCFVCNQCTGGKGASGVDFVMRFLGVDFLEAKKRIMEVLPGAPIEAKTAMPQADIEARNKRDWDRSQRLVYGHCLASRYLVNRGIDLERLRPRSLRFAPDAYFDKERRVPALIAAIVGPDGKGLSLQRTFLREPGHKLDVPKKEQRKNATGPLPKGGAVRLFPLAETLGIAEGVETALSAAQMFDLPVWATLGKLIDWEPPPGVKNVIIFGDTDPHHAGGAMAWGLAHKLSVKKIQVEQPKMPEFDPSALNGVDWNTLLQAEMR